MEKNKIEQHIRDNVRNNFIDEPNVFPQKLIEILALAKELAIGYWDHRTSNEINLDAKANVTSSDYYIWVVGEMTLIKHQMLYN